MLRLKVADFFKVSGMPVTVLVMPEQGALELHTHEFAELTLILGGRASHLTAEGQYPVAAGDVFYIPPDQPHGFADAAGLSLVNILILPELLGRPDRSLGELPGYQALFEWEPRYRDAQGFAGHLRLPPEAREQLMGPVRELEHESRANRAGGVAMVRALMMQIMIQLARGYGEHVSPAGRRMLAVQRVIKLIEKDTPVTVEELAGKIGMSASSLKRAFREITGTSPIAYRLGIKIARACHLMKTTDRTLTEIALECGFSDSNYFSRQFRARMGCTPREWRGRTV